MLYVKKFKTDEEKLEYEGPKKYISYTDVTEVSTVNPVDYSQEYLTFNILTDGTITYHIEEQGVALIPVSYSLDNGETWSEPSDSISLTVHPGDVIMWKSEREYEESEIQYGYFFGGSTAAFDVEGNIMSLMYSDDFIGQTSLKDIPMVFAMIFQMAHVVNAKNLILPATTLTDYCYAIMFSSCEDLKYPPKLPADELSNNCYNSMFANCTSLIKAPALPATSLRKLMACYIQMFAGCTSLKKAPELPADEISPSCYAGMFQNCTSLVKAPALPADETYQTCYAGMFQNCTSLTKAPELPSFILTQQCYQQMFSGCTSLTKAPELPAKTLAQQCYQQMFSGCTSLTKAPALPATILSIYCYENMFSGCTSLTTAPELPAIELTDYCYSNMFSGCTSLVTAPELTSETLENYCYAGMFTGCTQLNYIKMLANNISAENCLQNWVYNVAPTGTFVKHINMYIPIDSVDGIPIGWTVEEDGEDSPVI